MSQFPAVTFEHTHRLTPAISRFLRSVLWGTEGALYRLPEVDSMLRQLSNPMFLTLTEEETLVAVRMILEKEVRCDGQPLHCFYHSFFSVAPGVAGRGYGKRLAHAMLEHLEPRLDGRGLIYSHVERGNRRSLAVHEALGYQRVGSFHTVSFNRLWPRMFANAQKMSRDDAPFVLQALSTQYADHAMFDFPQSLDPEHYFVWRDGSEPVAGLQVSRQRWQICQLTGIGGALALKLLPRIPLVRTVFNPADFRFLKVGNVFYRQGRAAAVFRLLESVVAQFRLKTALMFWDPMSPVYKGLTEAGSFGLLNALTQTPAEILGRFYGFTRVEIAEFCQRPKVISPTDI